MIKHVGRHGDKKVVVLYRTIPGLEHMCLVCYSDLLPRMYHDSVMSVVESTTGQQANELSDALHRNLLPDGRNTLETLHREGLIKKVPTNQVILTPNAKTAYRLDEINEILSKMKDGADAVAKMAEIDAQAGMHDPKKSLQQTVAGQVADVLSDATLAENLRSQAAKMTSDANGLLAEAKRLTEQANEITQKLSNVVINEKPKVIRRRRQKQTA